MAGNTQRLHNTPPTSSCCWGTRMTSTQRNTPKPYDYLLKLLLIGDAQVGKSSLLIRFAEDVFPENYLATIGVDFKIKTLELDGRKVKLQIWDTGGGEQFMSILPSYYRGSRGMVLVYDVTKQISFDNIKGWMDHIEQHTTEKVSMILLGNKCDLTTNKVVDYITAKEFADQHGLLFMETSAKDGTNVEEAFITLAAAAKNAIFNE